MQIGDGAIIGTISDIEDGLGRLHVKVKQLLSLSYITGMFILYTYAFSHFSCGDDSFVNYTVQVNIIIIIKIIDNNEKYYDNAIAVEIYAIIEA